MERVRTVYSSQNEPIEKITNSKGEGRVRREGGRREGTERKGGFQLDLWIL